MVTVDRLVIISTVLFSIAAILVLISISRPRWIVSGHQGKQINGLYSLYLISI